VDERLGQPRDFSAEYGAREGRGLDAKAAGMWHERRGRAVQVDSIKPSFQAPGPGAGN